MSLFTPDKEWEAPPTPFGGFIDGKPAVTGPHLLVSGVSGSGKTRRVLAPAILMWKGPVVAISSKPDLVDTTLTNRAQWGGANHTYVLDLSGEVPAHVLPEGVSKVVVDPTVLIENDDDAIDIANLLIQSGTAGAMSGSIKSGDAFWDTIAISPLAAILRAASIISTDSISGIDWARKAISKQVLKDEDPEETPSWELAVEILEDSIIGDKLVSAIALESKMRDSIAITMESALAPWMRSTVIGNGTEKVFTPDLLENPGATLYIIAPATGIAAGAAVSVVDVISKRWRANQSESVKLPHLLMVVDEATNTMPWPKLPVVVTESRAMGISLLIAVQATQQFSKRYGKEGMEELRSIFPSTLILVGAPEKIMLENAAWWSGKTERTKAMIDHQHRQGRTSERADNLEATDLLPRDMDHGRLLRGTRPGHVGTIPEAGLLVDLRDISKIKITRKP